MMQDDSRDDEAAVGSPSKAPTFNGQLKLTDFMFKSSTPGAVRRSPRLTQSPSNASLSSVPSLPPARSQSSTPTASRKRKLASETSSVGPGGSRSGTPGSASPKKRSRPPSGYAPPSTYAHLAYLPDALGPDLLILFCGLNPGVQTSRTGHAYAHPSNLFWKLLYSSGITPVPCQAPDDRSLPERFSCGFTNIVSRPTRNGAELSKAEMDEGVSVLEDKVREWRPESVCLVGKGIWESLCRVRKGRVEGKNEFKYGWQPERENMGVIKGGNGQEAWKGARVFVATSTSGLAATLRPEEKEKIWRELGAWCEGRRKERAEAAEAADDTQAEPQDL